MFIKGTVPGSGCWFSTDYLAQDTCVETSSLLTVLQNHHLTSLSRYSWIEPDTTTNSMNSFATSTTLEGPWIYWNVSAPWQPRASAAITTSRRYSSAWLGSGVSFNEGVPSTPVYSDVWQVKCLKIDFVEEVTSATSKNCTSTSGRFFRSTLASA